MTAFNSGAQSVAPTLISLDTPSAVQNTAAPAHTVIVGARGRMGAMFRRRARSVGVSVEGVDIPFDADTVAAACAEADLLLLCVPVAVLGETLQTFVPYLRPTTIVADITSVKEQPLTLMQRYWQGPVVGTHPLFGPGAHNDEPQPVAIVPGATATEAHVSKVVAFFEAIGCHPFMTTASAHDKAVARIQNLNFITNLVYFALLADDESLTPFLTPSFRRRHAAARKMLTEDAPMFAGLFDANPYSQEVVRQYSKLLNIASAGDVDLLCNRAVHWWPDASLPEHARSGSR